MKKLHSKWLKGGLLGLLAIFGMASCSDDHFDVSSTNASGTLWDNIVATNQLDSFAMILERTIVNKKEYGTPATLSYKGLLQSPRVFTVWAPKDGTYNAAYWLNLLDQGDNETVEKWFVKNHIANYNYPGSTPEVVRLLMYNSKYSTYDVPNNTFNDVAISSDAKYKNIPSENGTLHLLEKDNPYSYSLREIMEARPELANINQYIEDKDTLIFLPNSSVAGSTVNGEIQYVDSVFSESNKVLPSISTNEDSLCAAIYPSNEAWNEAWEKIQRFYNYHENNKYTYYDEDISRNVTDSVDGDSLKELYTSRVIFNNMYYSLYEQVGFDTENATPESVQNWFNTADSLVSTSYYWSNYIYHQHAPQCHELAEGKLPIQTSNGFAFITDHFNFKANKSWQYDIIVQGEYSGAYLNRHSSSRLSTTSPYGIRHTITDGNRNDSVKGVLSNNSYQEFVPYNATAKPTVAFNLPNVLSGTYDIYAVIVPENMDDPSNTSPRKNKFTATLQYDLSETGRASTISGGKNFESDPSKIDTILLFENFKFPYCYYGISNCYPILSLTTQQSVSERRTVTTTLYIDCFILKGKEE